LAALLAGVLAARAEAGLAVPVFLKVAPDLSPGEIDEIASVIREAGIDGLIATNTTLSRNGLASPTAREAGGLSGAPLFDRSTRVLARFSAALGPDMPIIGVGGIASAADAYAKVRAGATAVQLYTGMVYEGLSLIPRIARGLDALLERDGVAHVADAVGRDRDRWL